MYLLIDGQRHTTSKEGQIPVHNPATGERLGVVPNASEEDVQEALRAARRGARLWAATPIHKRAEAMHRFAALLEGRRAEIAEIVCKEVGKPLVQAGWEVDTAVRLFRGFAEQVKHLFGKTMPLDAQQGVERDLLYTRREPLGVIVAVVPFNFPIDLYAHKVAPAIAAGNAVIVKPSEETPLSAVMLTEMLWEAGVPGNVVRLVTGYGAQAGQWLTSSPLVNGITLTGSERTGVKVARNGAQHLVRLLLELGGNDPLIVFPDADLELAAREAVSGRLVCNGQVCCANKRLLVHRKVFTDFVDLVLASLKDYHVGNPLQAETRVGPLIHERAAATVEGQIQQTVAQGARLIQGGKRLDRTFVTPAVLLDVTPEMDVARDMEIFGPVFPILPFETDDEAYEIANASRYGLNAAVFTRDVNRAATAGYRIESGTVVINGASTYRPDVIGFGGFKMSGLGREGLASSLEELTQIKNVVIRNALSIPGGL